jgi:hypothetical protein
LLQGGGGKIFWTADWHYLTNLKAPPPFFSYL